MKKIFILLSTLALCFFMGCGETPVSSVTSAQQPTPDTEATPDIEPTPEVTPEPTPEPPADMQALTGISGTLSHMRPVAVMVNNQSPRQWGTSSASVIIEGVTEGKFTNLALLYDGIPAMPKVGPVTQGKDLFWQFAIAQNAILVQNGWNTYAENLLNCYAYQPIDARLVGVLSFDYEKETVAENDEFNWYTKGESVTNSLNIYGMSAEGETTPLFNFGVNKTGTSGASSVTIGYSELASTTLTYNPDLLMWQMFKTDGTAQIDTNDGSHVAFDNVIILGSTPSVKDNKFTRDYNLTSGKALYLSKGEWQEITWQKGDVTATPKFYTADGSELIVNTGKTYIGIYGNFKGQTLSLTDTSGASLYEASALVPVV